MVKLSMLKKIAKKVFASKKKKKGILDLSIRDIMGIAKKGIIRLTVKLAK